ncbi:hypothetical protein LTR25_000180 [Vermiconidia calcicola]|uniref:Uncharacterized protein n=1 Tax=Vermiconidia calcicola TaxID=1690605 RepID=A0AAV9QJ58_9PEZI|nr:hypothetical protein LTR25_000180 [Vermiconidia calcicola]
MERSESPPKDTSEALAITMSLLYQEFDKRSSKKDKQVESDAVVDDPLFTDRQKALAGYFDLLGVGGLAYADDDDDHHDESITADDDVEVLASSPIPSSEANDNDDVELGHSSWVKITDDYASGGAKSRMIFYLLSLGPDLTVAFLRGDLPRKLQHDADFRAKYAPYVTCRETQGVYSVFLARTSSTKSSQVSPDQAQLAGRGLTPHELMKVVADMRDYIDTSRPKSSELAQDIDQLKRGPNLDLDYSFGQRRYGGGERRDLFDMHERWLKTIERSVLRQYRALQGTDKHGLLDLPFLRCLAYVGLGINTLERATNHWSHKGRESPLYGLYTATTWTNYGDLFGVQEYTYQVFKTTRIEDIGLDEIVASLLLSAYPWEGGLSYTWAGSSKGATGNRDNRAYTDGLTKNGLSIHNSKFLDDSIQDWDHKQTSLQDMLEFADQRDELYRTFKNISSGHVDKLAAIQRGQDAYEEGLALIQARQKIDESRNKLLMLKQRVQKEKQVDH